MDPSELDIGEATAVSTVRPAEALVWGLPAPVPDGMNGDVSCIRACLAHAGVDASSADLYGVSGAAFRALFYRRADNPGAEGEPDWCWTSSVLSARDAHRAIADFCGAAIERKPNLEPEAAWALVELETSQGRPVISYGVGGPFEAVIITGYGRRAGRRYLRVQSKFLSARDAEVDITGKANWAGEGAPLRNPIVLMRAGAGPVPDFARRAALRIDACRWAVAHARAGKERLETGKVYAAGLAAFEAFADFLEAASSGLGESLATPGEAEDVALFIAVMAAEWRRARRAAALFLDAWAFKLEELGKQMPQPPGGLGGLRRAAESYRGVALALDAFWAAAPAPWEAGGEQEALAALRDPARREAAARVLREARDREAFAVDALASACGA